MNGYMRGRGARRAIALLAALTLSGAACGGTEQAEAHGEAPPPVLLGPDDVVEARITSLGAGVTVSGPLDPAEAVNVKAQVAGTVRNLRVDRGTAVRRGQVMATIEATGVRSQAAGARAGVAAAEANLALARQRQEAARTLHRAGAMSAIDLQAAEAGYEAAQAQLAAARAQAASATEAAGRTTITAPIAGSVSARMVDEGEAVDPGGELFTVVNSRTLELRGQLGVAEAGRVRVGQPVLFELDAYPGEEFRGRVARIDPTADPGTRQVGVYVQLPNATGRLIGGQYARGRVITAAATTGVAVPETAVRHSGDSASVFVVLNDRVQRRAVTLGARDEALAMIAVTAGLREGERVVVNPSSQIADGTAVTIASDRPASPPAAADTQPGRR